MSFDKSLLAVESHDLSQADKSIVRVSSFPRLFLNDKITYTLTFFLNSYCTNKLPLGNISLVEFRPKI